MEKKPTVKILPRSPNQEAVARILQAQQAKIKIEQERLAKISARLYGKIKEEERKIELLF
jgi:2',3'-cyclic-nucleotide 2'-phosphodiesterase (5'-nucleotidase family)